jgi:hypothetical protein
MKMFKKIALAAVLAAVTMTSANAGTRDLSVINSTAKAQIFMGLGYYKNHCARLPVAAGEVYDQLETMAYDGTSMDQATLNTMKSQLSVMVNLGSDDDKAKLCNTLEPTVKKLTATAQAMPVTPDPVVDEDDSDNSEGLPNFTDQSRTCDKDLIEKEMTGLIQETTAGYTYGLKLLYIKGKPVEVSRSSNELVCSIAYVTNRGTQKANFKFYNEDGHYLVAFKNK